MKLAYSESLMAQGKHDDGIVAAIQAARNRLSRPDDLGDNVYSMPDIGELAEVMVEAYLEYCGLEKPE